MDYLHNQKNSTIREKQCHYATRMHRISVILLILCGPQPGTHENHLGEN